MFHLFIYESVSKVFSGSGEGAQYLCAHSYRSFPHGKLIEACVSLCKTPQIVGKGKTPVGLSGPGADKVKTIADSLSHLYTLRLKADYNVFASVTTAEVETAVDKMNEAFDVIRELKQTHPVVFEIFASALVVAALRDPQGG